MASMNVVLLMGNLVADVEGRSLSSGTEVANFRLAVNEEYTGKDGKKVESTVFVDVEAWGKQAGPCRQYLSKGSPVLVEGRLKLDQWQGKDGEKKSKLVVKADRVQFLGSPSGGRKETGGDAGPRLQREPVANHSSGKGEASWPDDSQAGVDDEPPF